MRSSAKRHMFHFNDAVVERHKGFYLDQHYFSFMFTREDAVALARCADETQALALSSHTSRT